MRLKSPVFAGAPAAHRCSAVVGFNADMKFSAFIWRVRQLSPGRLPKTGPAGRSRRNARSVRRPFFLLGVLLAALGTFGAGCRLVQSAANVPGKAVQAITPGTQDKKGVDPVEVQQRLMRFADAFSAAMVASIDQLHLGTNALDAERALQWKISITKDACSIVSGPNAIADQLDMTIFVTAIRMTLEDYWQPKLFGESAAPMLKSCQNFETNIWSLTAQVLTPEQLNELHRSIAVWYQKNPIPQSVLSARAVGFASEVAEAASAEKQKNGSVFGLLMLDPFAGLDPATREIAQTRLLAERALYVTQKMPTLLRWQTELLSLNSVQLPEVRQVIANSTQIAASMDRVARLAETLPGQISTERAEILKALHSQEQDVAALMDAGTRMSDSLNTTVTNFNALMKRFGVGETNNVQASPTNAEPFRIQDYTASAAQMELTARQLNDLLLTLDQTLGSTNLAKLTAQAVPVIQTARDSGKEVVNYAFWKAVLLIVILLVAALIYRAVTIRLAARAKSTASSP
jgi:hypothetical protein